MGEDHRSVRSRGSTREREADGNGNRECDEIHRDDHVDGHEDHPDDDRSDRHEHHRRERPLVSIEGVTKHFPVEGGLFAGIEFDPTTFPPVGRNRNRVRAVEDVSFEIYRGETVGLVGESGCGKSTLARTILRLIEPTEGRVFFDGVDLTTLDRAAMRRKRSEMQLVFQDSRSSLNPRLTVGRIIEEPMAAHGMGDPPARETRARSLLEMVGLEAHHYDRYPHQFSGGQRQRIALARALSVEPEFIVCDEPVSSLDVSVQAKILRTMDNLQEEFGLTYLFIAHDLSVIRQIADRVAVMYLGNLVEMADTTELFERPRHPYTKALLDSIPIPDPRANRRREKHVLWGTVPSPTNPPSGCRFRTRCPVLLPPTEYDLTDTEWDVTRSFIRAVERRTIEPEPPEAIRDRYFPTGVPDGEAGAIVAEAIRLVSQAVAESPAQRSDSDREAIWCDATILLLDAFVKPSICARERPAYSVEPEHGDGTHFTACHHHR